MESNLFGLEADIYMNNYKNKYVMSNFNKSSNLILPCKRYVNDTFIIFNHTLRQIKNLYIY